MCIAAARVVIGHILQLRAALAGSEGCAVDLHARTAAKHGIKHRRMGCFVVQLLPAVAGIKAALLSLLRNGITSTPKQWP